jgi:hypothetical protein
MKPGNMCRWRLVLRSDRGKQAVGCFQRDTMADNVFQKLTAGIAGRKHHCVTVPPIEFIGDDDITYLTLCSRRGKNSDVSACYCAPFNSTLPSHSLVHTKPNFPTHARPFHPLSPSSSRNRLHLLEPLIRLHYWM